PGSGAGRLARISDFDGSWRFKVAARPCGSCDGVQVPPPVTDLVARALDGDVIEVTFTNVGFGTIPVRAYEIRYRNGPMSIADFAAAPPVPPVAPAAPGSPARFQLTQHEGIQAQHTFTIGVRAIDNCGKVGELRTVQVTTPRQKYATIEGCFIATAAYGSDL